MDLPAVLTDAPSHFNWGIETDTSEKFITLKLQLDDHLAHNPGVMTIHALLFQSFIHVSKFKDPTPDYVKGREYLDKAYEEIEHISNEEEKQGYLIVAKCNEAIMALGLEEQTTTLEAEIEDLLSDKTALSQACIDSVRAFALATRYGLKKYDEAKIYYQKALEVQPNNTEWLFRLAIAMGRQSRRNDGLGYNEDKEQERRLYEKIIHIDNNHALAHASLGHNLLLKGDHDEAISHANEALQLAPHHSEVLLRASKVFRKTNHFDDALHTLQNNCPTSQDDSCQNSVLFHEFGLVYRDMYRIGKKKARERRKRPDKDLLHKALENFTRAIKADPANLMAGVDKALIYERLGMMREVEEEYMRILTTKTNEDIDQVHISTQYNIFLHNQQRQDEACKRFNPIHIAVKLGAISCSTRKDPIPKFSDGLKRNLDAARNGYKRIMEEKVQSDDPEEHSQGLKKLAWLDQVFGEHDSARARYEEYLESDENKTDSDAIHFLVMTLILLGDFEEARKRIQELKGLQKLDLAQQLTIECALEQGEEVQGQGDDELAKELFQEAIDCGSMEACQKLKDILIKNPDISRLEFRTDCAKILHCCEKNEQIDTPLCKEIKKLMNLEEVTFGKLRKYHLNLEMAILGCTGSSVMRAILDKASETIYEARNMLDRVMISFRKRHYSVADSVHSIFFNIHQDYYNKPKTRHQIKEEILKKLNTYKWEQFDTRFPDLLEFLVKLQPAYPRNTNWYLALSQLAIRDKHLESIRYSQYHIPVILNGNKGVAPIPRGMPVYGDAPVHQGQHPRVTYELVTVVDVARKAAVEVERIVAEFYKHM